jgi:hypothetical protein
MVSGVTRGVQRSKVQRFQPLASCRWLLAAGSDSSKLVAGWLPGCMMLETQPLNAEP